MAEIPLFPLPLILFPGGRLELQIFEIRYLDMVKRCMQDDTGFGIVMIEQGEQALLAREQQLPSVSHYGTYCKIVDFDQRENGMLAITVEGQVKFVIRDHYEGENRLMMGDIRFLEKESQAPIPEKHAHLANLLGTLMDHEGISKAVKDSGLEIDFEEALDVGARLTELLPCPNRYKQRLFEMKDPVARLSELEKLIERMQQSK
jgi:Lon protease-like protein